MADSTDPAEAGWAAYYRAHEGRPVSPLLRRAIAYFSQGQISRQAVDLGCGAGNEARFLLESGRDLFAIDREPLAVQRVQDLLSEAHRGRLEAVVAAFEDLRHLPHSDLIHAGLSLPFCRPQNFGSLWALIRRALKPGGMFVGHFFGDRDDWSRNPGMTFHTADQVMGLLAELDVKLLHEHEADGKSLQGPKHWHRFDIVAMKPAMHGANRHDAEPMRGLAVPRGHPLRLQKEFDDEELGAFGILRFPRTQRPLRAFGGRAAPGYGPWHTLVIV